MTSVRTLLLLGPLAAACASSPPRAAAPAAQPDIAVDGDPNGLVWDGGALFFADGANDRLLRWDASGGVSVVATLPPQEKPGLGQPARLPDGSFAVPRFGHGQEGGIVMVVDGQPRPREGLARERKRIGLAAGPDGTLYEAYHVGHGEAAGIAAVAADGGVRDVVPGLAKPVGVQLAGDWLYWSDQKTGAVDRCRLPECASPERVGEVPGVDLFAVDSGGVVYAGTRDGAVLRVAGGAATPIASDLGRVRGVAVDEAAGRLFVAARRGERAFIRVLPLAR
jgi:hypothetical protein